LGNIRQADFIDELKLKGILEAVYKEYIERELSLPEREVLGQIMHGKILETNLKQQLPLISNSKLKQLLRTLSKLNLVKKSRDYTDYESVFWVLNPDIAKILGERWCHEFEH
jgi:DNA-binding MarR family transcriptional regulator